MLAHDEKHEQPLPVLRRVKKKQPPGKLGSLPAFPGQVMRAAALETSRGVRKEGPLFGLHRARRVSQSELLKREFWGKAKCLDEMDAWQRGCVTCHTVSSR